MSGKKGLEGTYWEGKSNRVKEVRAGTTNEDKKALEVSMKEEKEGKK